MSKNKRVTVSIRYSEEASRIYRALKENVPDFNHSEMISKLLINRYKNNDSIQKSVTKQRIQEARDKAEMYRRKEEALKRKLKNQE